MTVRPDHIAHGLPGDKAQCPVALAVAEAFRVAPGWVFAHYDEITVLTGRAAVPFRKFPVPPSVAEWMALYDGGHESLPFQFVLG